MTSKRKAQTPITGPEFNKDEELAKEDVEQWFSDGAGLPSHPTLDEYGWDGNIVGGVLLNLSPDNKKVTNGRFFLTEAVRRGVYHKS